MPIIVISARGKEQDKVGALDAGADDYLIKPFGSAELLARLRVALRHAARGSLPTPDAVHTVRSAPRRGRAPQPRAASLIRSWAAASDFRLQGGQRSCHEPVALPGMR